MRKKITSIILILLSLFILASAQTKPNVSDSAITAKITKATSPVSDSISSFQILSQQNLSKLFYLQTELQTQKFLKSIFLLGFIFMTIVVIILFVFYYTKIKQILKLIQIQEKEIKLRQFEVDKLSIIINNVMDATSITDKDGNIIWANKSFERIFGFNPENVKTNVFETNDPDIKELHEQLKQQHKPIQYTTELQNANGQKIWIQRRIIPLVNSKNEIMNFAVIDTDYTALKLATKNTNN